MATPVPKPSSDLLPVTRTRLVGREAECAAGQAFLLIEAVPLLTVTGPGGVGKTRLALGIGANVAPHFSDGAIWVDFAPISDPALVPETLAVALELSPADDEALSARLIQHLRPRQTLLLLDNCEHLVAAVGELTAVLLAACPALQVLATSRAPLHLVGEQVLALSPLPVPSAGAAELEQIQPVPAVRLFVQQARRADARFVLDDENAGTVAEICRRLDGLPLALELAASRSPVLSPAALLALLSQLGQVLGRGPRDASPRHQTIRDAIAWSYALLSPAEQAAFRSLAVFAGGWPLEAAAAVCDLSITDVLERLETLVDQSLVVRQHGPTVDPRFNMLETIRAYALDELTASGDEPNARARHADWIIDRFETAWYGLLERMEWDWLSRLEPDRDNLRAAIAWLDQSDDGEGLLRLVASAAAFWHYRSYRQEARRWLARVLDDPRSAAAPTTARIRALQAAGMMARNQGDLTEAISRAMACLTLSREVGDAWGTHQALELLGYIALAQGNYYSAMPYFEESLHLMEPPVDQAQTADARWMLGLALLGQNELEWAERHLEETLILMRAVGEQWTIGLILNTLGLVACVRGHLSVATRHFAEALGHWQAIGSRENLLETLSGVATLAAAGSPQWAARLFGAAAASRERLGHAAVLPEQAVHERAEVAARATLGEPAFAAHRLAGHALTLDQALAEAAAFLARSTEGETASTAPPSLSPVSPESCALTWREQEVLALLCQHLTNPEIAACLFVSPRTVGNHVSSILGKVGAANRREAVAIAVRLGLV